MKKKELRRDYARFFALGFAVLGLASFPAHDARALDLAILGGTSISQRITTATTTSKSDGLLGLGGGVEADFPLSASGAFVAQTGLFYVQRNIGFGTGNEVKSTILQVPVLLRVRFWRFSLGAGGYLGYGLGNIQATAGGVSTDTTYEASNLSKLDFGAMGSLDFTLPLASSVGVVVDARYAHGLKNVTSMSGTTVNFTDMQLFAGLRFSFGGPGGR